MTARISKEKRDLIREDYLGDRIPCSELSKKLGLHTTTIYNYRRCFDAIKRDYPDKINDYNFLILLRGRKLNQPELYKSTQLLELFPQILDKFDYKAGIRLRPLYAIYKSMCPNSYSYKMFVLQFYYWRKANNICYYHHLRVKSISKEDFAQLINWRKRSSETHKWKKAVVILDSYKGRHIKEIAKQIETKRETVLLWIDIYKKIGLSGLERKEYTLTEERAEKVKIKRDNLIRILHQTPKIYNINRASWRLQDIADVYKILHNEFISKTAVRENLIRTEYGFRKSREVLTSPDPNFRQKIDKIKSILSNLKPDEKFFSIDEYGHFAVKLKGGRSLVKKGEIKSVPQRQKSKGFMVVIAALELSKNQVTHFYSRKKDTNEMLKLIEILSTQYKDQKKLYLSWDAASWHSSKLLKERINMLNETSYREHHKTPEIELAPLPSSAQFLNVIESVFSGLARAVIHNSDYDSVEDCQLAIDRHFKERNENFLLNPKQAGNKIWGKEIVKAVFDESNHCQTRK